MKRSYRFALATAALAVTLGAFPALPASAQQEATTSLPALPRPKLATIDAARTPPTYRAPYRSTRAVRTYLTPSQLEPYAVVNQRTVRDSRYANPMSCPMTGLLSPAQMEAAWQACSDRFFNVDHSH